jgi:small nuclear ribonucleoprotein (snRNP)-like protein
MLTKGVRRWIAIGGIAIPPVLGAAGVTGAIVWMVLSRPTPVEPVRVTLADDQIVVGDVQTTHLELDGALGRLHIPLDDVGEIAPTTGPLGASDDDVTVWLRNGTELRGRWLDPALTLGMTVGGEPLTLDMPMADVGRVQTTGATLWPDRPVFRVQTRHGDDLLIDPETTRVTLVNGMGTLSPFLSECRNLAPLPNGDWRIELQNGSVFTGPLQHDRFDFAMPLGPDRVTIPVADVTRLTWQSWDHMYAPSSGKWFQSETYRDVKAL